MRTLEDFSAWLQVKTQAKGIAQQVSLSAFMDRRELTPRILGKKGTSATICLNATLESKRPDPLARNG